MTRVCRRKTWNNGLGLNERIRITCKLDGEGDLFPSCGIDFLFEVCSCDVAYSEVDSILNVQPILSNTDFILTVLNTLVLYSSLFLHKKNLVFCEGYILYLSEREGFYFVSRPNLTGKIVSKNTKLISARPVY